LSAGGSEFGVSVMFGPTRMGQQVAGVAKMMGKWSSGRFVGMEEASAWLICYSMIFLHLEVLATLVVGW